MSQIVTDAGSIPEERPLRVLLWNICYCMGWRGNAGDIKRWHRCVACRRSVRKGISHDIERHIAGLSPDVCCLLEVDSNVPLAADLSGPYPNQTVAVKYAEHGVLRLIPFFRHRCNAVLSRASMPVRRHDFSKGRKRLFLEVEVSPGVSLWVVHLPIGGRKREYQIREFAERLSPDRKHLVVGDFNAFHGTQETKPLTDAGLELLEPTATYPAARPRLPLDLVLHSAGLRVERVPTPVTVGDSDHLPVCVNIWGAGGNIAA